MESTDRVEWTYGTVDEGDTIILFNLGCVWRKKSEGRGLSRGIFNLVIYCLVYILYSLLRVTFNFEDNQDIDNFIYVVIDT